MSWCFLSSGLLLLYSIILYMMYDVYVMRCSVTALYIDRRHPHHCSLLCLGSDRFRGLCSSGAPRLLLQVKVHPPLAILTRGD